MMQLPSRTRLSLFASALFASGCALGPDFTTPAAPETARYTSEALPGATVSTAVVGGEAQQFLAGKALPDRWWTLFGAPKLDALVEQALIASPSVASAQAALRVAQLNYRAERSSLFPTVDGTFDASRQKIDTATFGNPGGGGVIYNLYNTSVGVSYGLDLWGGTRRGVEAERAAAEFQQWQLEATYQTLIANVVTTAFREIEQRTLMVGQELVIRQQESLLKITQARYDSGAIARSELLSMQSQVATERGKLPAYKLAMTQAQNQLAVYLGKLPSEYVSAPFELDELNLPQELPISLPSSLVRQRPDIRAAEATMHEASARVGIATANLLPQIALTAKFGTQASVIDQLFTGNVWSIAGNITQPLFNAGKLRAERRAAFATLDKTAADYRQTVLDAFRNVADALRALETDAEYLQAQYTAADLSAQSLKLTESQYKLGSSSSLAVLDAQTRDTQARAGYIAARVSRLSDTAALFQALGGGWATRNADAELPNGPPGGTLPTESASSSVGAP
ncbi:efflux transporter outer membrane subunit [Nevskia ramosa]|uniref:efflux transporter outer membrane subunit n=1 Tax=Nevskia ramosa TaxID=64002 RepID=UPI003D0EF636